MVNLEELRSIVANKPEVLTYIGTCYTAYTLLAFLIAIFVIVSLESSQNDEECEEWASTTFLTVNETSYLRSENNSTLSITDGYVCTSTVSASASALSVNSTARILAYIIFIIYLFHGLVRSKYFQIKVDQSFEKEEEKPIRHRLLYVNMCKRVLIIIVEVVGLYLITYSTTNHDVIINSTAALFLGETDDCLMEILLTSMICGNQVAGTYEQDLFFLSFEFENDGKGIIENDKKTHPAVDQKHNSVVPGTGEEQGVVFGGV